MLNHREVLEALLAGETLVDVNNEVTVRFEENNIVSIHSFYGFSITLENISLLDWKIKHKTININGYEVPEPIRVRPRKGELYYIPYLTDSKVQAFKFAESITTSRWLKEGLLHKTKEAAELHLEALLSFTKHE
jgi:hypothetical protein